MQLRTYQRHLPSTNSVVVNGVGIVQSRCPTPGGGSGEDGGDPSDRDRRCRRASDVASRFLLEEGARETGLSDDRPEGADSQLAVIRNWDRPRRERGPLLHDDVATMPANFLEPVRRKDAADRATRKDAQPTQQLCRAG